MMALRKTKRSPNGDSNKTDETSVLLFELNSLSVDTFNGKIEVEWDKNAATTPLVNYHSLLNF